MKKLLFVLVLLAFFCACKTVEYQEPLYGAGATNAAGDTVVGTDKDKVE